MTNHHNDQLSDSPKDRPRDQPKDQPRDQLDKLLTDGMPKPPDHFTDTVLSRIAQQTPYDYSRPPSSSTKTVWPSLALAASALLGVFQVVGFIFGLWIPTVAG